MPQLIRNICQIKVEEFMAKFGQDIHHTPRFNTAVAVLRRNLILEEANEYALASNSQNLVELADSIGDLLYVVYGAASANGINVQPIFDEVHRSNMTKVWEDGTVHRREDGNVIKPPTYSPADIAGVLKYLKGN